MLILLISTLSNNEDRERDDIQKRDLVDIASRARSRDPGAFAEIFDLFFEKLRRYAYYRTGDMQLAEDLASETLTSGLESIDRFRDKGGSIGAWLFGIERNLVARQKEVIGRAEFVQIGDDMPADEEGMTETLVIDRLTHEQLYTALSRLPEEQRDVVLLRFMEQYDVKTVARIVGKKPGAVRALQFRAISNLRALLETGEL